MTYIRPERFTLTLMCNTCFPKGNCGIGWLSTGEIIVTCNVCGESERIRLASLPSYRIPEKKKELKN